MVRREERKKRRRRSIERRVSPSLRCNTAKNRFRNNNMNRHEQMKLQYTPAEWTKMRSLNVRGASRRISKQEKITVRRRLGCADGSESYRLTARSDRRAANVR